MCEDSSSDDDSSDDGYRHFDYIDDSDYEQETISMAGFVNLNCNRNIYKER